MAQNHLDTFLNVIKTLRWKLHYLSGRIAVTIPTDN